jgi:hypothetical protein
VAAPASDAPDAPAPDASGLRATLRMEYPDLPVRLIDEALDRAYVVAPALRGDAVGPAYLARLARDRLTIARERRLAAARRSVRRTAAAG